MAKPRRPGSDGPFEPPKPVRESRPVPFLAIHQQHIQDTQGLLFAAVLVTGYKQDQRGLSRGQAEMVDAMQARLVQLHLAGKFPVSDQSYSVWIDPLSDTVSEAEIPNGTWLRHRMRDYLTLTLYVPHREKVH
jgi:hypothetical protein